MKQAFEPEQVMGLFGRGKPSSDGDTLIDTRTQEQLDSGDHERFSHYVKKEKIVESAVSGKPVTALCGKRDGFHLVTQISFQSVQHVKRFIPAFAKGQMINPITNFR